MAKQYDLITRAYCDELERSVDINEAHLEFFAQEGNRKGKRFTFYCSDQNCLATNPRPEVIGVNYACNTFKIPPHFRRHHKSTHADNCIYGAYDSIVRELFALAPEDRPATNTNFFVRHPNDGHRIIDELYIPSASTKAESDVGFGFHQDREKLTRHILNAPIRTCLLDAVVDQFEGMSDDEKKAARLKMPDGYKDKLTYKQVFRLAKYSWPTDTMRIYYGIASCYRHHKKNYFRIYFKGKLENWSSKLEATAIITDESLKNDKALPMTCDLLNKYSDNKKLFNFYILGSQNQTDNNTFNIDTGTLLLSQLSSRYIAIRPIKTDKQINRD